MAKHFMIYYKQGTGTYVVTEPRPWARENQHLFPGRNFVNDHPTTEEIENCLTDNHQFVVGHDDVNVKVIHNLDPNLGL